MPDRLRAELEMSRLIEELRRGGYIVYAARRCETTCHGSTASPWQVAVLAIYRADDPQVAGTHAALTDDQEQWRKQIVSGAYPLIGRVEGYADFEIDAEIRAAVAGYARTMRGQVKGSFRDLADALPSDEEEERLLRSGTRAELLELLKTYARLFD